MNDQKTRTAPVYVVRQGELFISAPVEQVWIHVLNYHTWQNYSIREHVSGPPGGEGELVYLKKDDGAPSTAYYARTLQLIPQRRALWKTFREGVDYFGVVDFNVEPVGMDGTRFFYQLLYEWVIPYETDEDLRAFERQCGANFDSLLSLVLPKLKALAERPNA